MAHEVETMAYTFRDRTDLPWHNLGNPIDQNSTPDEMLAAAELDWSVSKRPLYTSMTPSGEVGSDVRLQSLRMADYFALVRDSDNKILGPCGKDYVPTQNKEVFAFFKTFCESGGMSMETAGSLQGGKQVWVLAKINIGFTLPGGDRVEGYLLISSPHIWGKSLVIKFVATRVVCANTLAIAMGEAGDRFRMPHIRSFDAVVAKEAKETLGLSAKLLENFEKQAVLLSSTKVDQEVTVKFVADTFQPELMLETFGKGYYKLPKIEQVELILDGSVKVDSSQFNRSAYEALNAVNLSPGASMSPGTLWSAVNAVTYYIDHKAGRDRDNALTASWFGNKGAVKVKALDRAVQIAGVLA
jgi:phage/plasmid-like protein (TIGR03299 family)